MLGEVLKFLGSPRSLGSHQVSIKDALLSIVLVFYLFYSLGELLGLPPSMLQCLSYCVPKISFHPLPNIRKNVADNQIRI